MSIYVGQNSFPLKFALALFIGALVSSVFGGMAVALIGFHPRSKWIIGESTRIGWAYFTLWLFLCAAISTTYGFSTMNTHLSDAAIVIILSSLFSLGLPIVARFQRNANAPGSHITGAAIAAFSIRFFSTVRYVHPGWKFISLNFQRIMFRVIPWERPEIIPGWRPKQSPFGITSLVGRIREFEAQKR
jgi:hypothetical protein